MTDTRSRRATFLKWLRKMHGWIGLWGATLGLLFGSSGILLNHRAVLKIPAVQT
ncbi:MAG: peptidase [Massilia sp.]|nr:peptidase [Massilia sp.]